MIRQSGVRPSRVRGRGPWCIALLFGIAAAPALAQRARDDDKKGPGGPQPSQRPAPAPERSVPIIHEMPRQAPTPRMEAPRTEAPRAPVIISRPPPAAPPSRQPIQVAPPPAPRPVIIQAPKSEPPRQPVATPSTRPPITAAPPSRPPVFVAPAKPAPTPPSFTPPASSPKFAPNDRFTPPQGGFAPSGPGAPPSRPPSSFNPSNRTPPTKAAPTYTPPHTITPPPSDAAPRVRPNERPSIWTAPRQAEPASNWTTTSTRERNPFAPNNRPAPVAAAAPTDLVFAGDRADGRDGRDRSGRHDNWNDRDRWRDHDGRRDGWGGRTTVSVNIGLGFGNAWRCEPAPVYAGCFAPRACYPDPFWYRPCAGNPWWAHDRWGGWYVRSWSCWPDWWWYPTFYARSYPCGTFSYVRYARRSCDWGVAFSFSSYPAYTSCGLISPSVYTVYNPEPIYAPSLIYTQPTVSVIAPAPEPAPLIVASSSTLPAPATSEQLRISSDRELADVYLRLGDSPNAVRVYTDHIARFPGDTDAIRSYGVALIEADRAADGINEIERAYLIDPTLAQRPFQRELLSDPARLSRILDTATRQAANDNTPRAWLTVAILMQSNNQPAPARSALEKAKAAGLSPKVLEWLQATLPNGEQ